jgi:outer membrane protein insertion porin family
MRSQRDVFGLGYFDDVQVEFIPKGGDSNDIDLEFSVLERRLGTAGAGMGYSSATGITGFVQLGHNNLFGNGWDLNVHLERGSNRSQYELSFTEPWLFDRPISLGMELFDSEISRDIFDEARRGAGLTVGWPFPGLDYTRGFNTFRVERIEFPNIDSSISELDRERLQDTEGSSVSTRIGATRNSTDNPFYPTNGSRTSVNAEYSGGLLGGSIDFQKYRLDHRTYLKPVWRPVLMIRSRLGAVQPYKAGIPIPSNETFRLGGTLFDYLRGYDDYDVVPDDNIRIDSFGREVRFPGGNYMATFTAELQFPIADPLHGLMFYDMGNTWNELDDISLNEFKRGAGFGLRMEVPMLGILGLDYAYGFDRDGGASWKPHLIFGQQF